MPATITGIVFNDLNHNGILDPGEPRISNAYVVIQDPNLVCTTVQTNALGVYSFSGLTTAGNYNIFETGIFPGPNCPPTTFGQPPGFTNSTTFRTETITVQQTDIDNNVTLTGKNYGHDNPAVFTCVAVGYQVAVPQGQTKSEFLEINLVTGAPTTINSNLGLTVNAIGYNTLDNMIYGIEEGTTNLVRIDINGVSTVIGPVVGLPVIPLPYNVGTFNNAGQLLLYRANTANAYVIDVNQNSPTFGQVLSVVAIVPATSMADWTFNPVDGQLYGIRTNVGDVVQVNPLTGVVTPLVTVGLPLLPAGYGAVFTDAAGNVYAINNNTGDLYRIQITGLNATAQLFSKAIPSFQNDGAGCHNAFLEIDFGDAPDIAPGTGPGNYNTLLASNGPRHQIRNTLFLGTTVTAELDAWQDPAGIATGDDLVQGVQDDGIAVPIRPILTCSTAYSVDILVTNNTGQNANLYVWIDFNQDGVFAGEESATTIVVPSNVNSSMVTANFTIPGTLIPGNTFLRARLTTDDLNNTNAQNLTLEDTRSLGPASDGEVEDYIIEILDSTTLITPIKTADKTFAEPGDEINYTITIPNNTIYDAYNVVFKDVLVQGLTLVQNSLAVNGNLIPNPNLVTGVNLGDLLSGDELIVTFTVVIDNDLDLCGTTMSNQGFIDIEFCEGEVETIPTNIHTVSIECISLKVEKKADTDLVLVGNTVTYTITITNTGNVPVDNVVVTDEIDRCASFVTNSVTINGIDSPGADPEAGIPIGTLNPGETIDVGFTIQLDKVCCPPRLSNRALVNYEYTLGLPPEDFTLPGSEQSNLVVVNVGPTYFKQLSKDEYMRIPNQKPDIEDILNTLVDIEITDTKVINTPVMTSIEGQNLSGYKLIVEGILNQKVEYIADEPQQSVHAAHFRVPFSTFIILPVNYNGEDIEIDAVVEDVFVEKISGRTLFKNITFLIRAVF